MLKRQQKRKKYRGFDFMPASANNLLNGVVASFNRDNHGCKSLTVNSVVAGSRHIGSKHSEVMRNSASRRVLGILPTAPDAVCLPNPATNPNSYASKGLRYAMVNATGMNYVGMELRRGDVNIVADSGGFQMLTGVTDFVDPDSLIDYYNKTVDVGVGLDIPMPNTLFPHLLKRMAAITCRNNDYLRSKALPGIGIYDVAHGHSLQERKEYLEVTLEQDHGEGIALAGTSSLVRGERSVVQHHINGILSITYTLDKVRDRYNTAHILGTTTPLYMFMYYLILQSGFYPHLTADSSSYIQSAISGNYHQTLYPQSKFLFDNHLPTNNLPHKLTCQCPLCLVYQDTAKFSYASVSAIFHSLYYYLDMVKSVEALADLWVTGQASKEVIYDHLGTSNLPRTHFFKMLGMLEDILERGFQKGVAKNKSYIRSTSSGRSSGLFGGAKQQVDKAQLDRFTNIIASYERWHEERK